MRALGLLLAAYCTSNAVERGCAIENAYAQATAAADAPAQAAATCDVFASIAARNALFPHVMVLHAGRHSLCPAASCGRAPCGVCLLPELCASHVRDTQVRSTEHGGA